MSRAIAALRPLALLKWATPRSSSPRLLGVLPLVNRSSGPRRPARRGADSSLARQPIEPRHRGPDRAAPGRGPRGPEPTPGSYALLGDAYYQRARETGDPSYYTRADGSFAAALSRDPANVTAIAGQATLALARHDFSGGCDSPGGRAARAADGPPVRAPRRRADRARSLRRRGEHAEPDGSPEGEPHGLRADLLLPRAPRRPPRRAAGDALRGLGGRRQPRGRGLRPGPRWASF